MANEKSKTVNMSGKQGNDNKPLTREQLEQLAGNLQRQCQQFYNQLQEANQVIANFNEIGMLLDILGRSEHFSDKFVSRCAGKIEEIVNKAFDDADKTNENKEA
ncbi:MAG: hypothetical protein J6M44_08690 [Butyrivibrio sp.]|nr:hypothetical protein [Butyrivibrio sp.]